MDEFRRLLGIQQQQQPEEQPEERQQELVELPRRRTTTTRTNENTRRTLGNIGRQHGRVFTENNLRGNSTGGRKRKRKVNKKSKARMTKQKRKVKGFMRNVRISSTGRKYVLLHGKKHYL